MKVGVLALQGAFREQREVFAALGCEAFEVRSARDLAATDALVLPGGESTAIAHLLRTGDLLDPLKERIEAGVPVLATCAGLIISAREVVGGLKGQVGLDILDVTVKRNAYGHQQQSFEAPIDISISPDPFPGVFIRAPVIERVGDDMGINIPSRAIGRFADSSSFYTISQRIDIEATNRISSEGGER